MEVPVTQFRKQLFSYLNQALAGEEIWVLHKDQRFRITSEKPKSRLERATPMKVWADQEVDINSDEFKSEFLAEMEAEWEQEWDELLGPRKDVEAQP